MAFIMKELPTEGMVISKDPFKCKKRIKQWKVVSTLEMGAHYLGASLPPKRQLCKLH